MAVLESVATEGRGVRESFVFAVRLALDRVRELLRERALPLAPPEVQSSNELLDRLKEIETPAAAAPPREERIAAPEPAAPESAVPLPPDAAVPPGMIWPPIDGRIALHEACAVPFTPRRLPHGDWVGEVPGWRFHSPAQAVYTNAEVGRRGLVEWARLHAGGQRWLSGPRVLVLAESGRDTWRLWQIVRAEESLRDVLTREIADGSPEGLLRRLFDAGRILLTATDTLGFVPCRLPLRIDTIGAPRGVPLYVGFLPDPFLLRPPQPFQPEQRPALLRRELGALASTELRGFSRESFPPLRSVVRATDPPAVVEALRDVLRDAGLCIASTV
jgi:hypothetical protein